MEWLKSNELYRHALSMLREGGAAHIRGGDRSSSGWNTTMGGEGGVLCPLGGELGRQFFNPKHTYVCMMAWQYTRTNISGCVYGIICTVWYMVPLRQGVWHNKCGDETRAHSALDIVWYYSTMQCQHACMHTDTHTDTQAIVQGEESEGSLNCCKE